jgi:TolB protein
MTNFASLRGPVGMNRVYVHTGPGLEQRRLLDSLRAGRSFATNGPLLALSVEGHGLGEELRLSRPGTLRARIRLRSNVPIDHLELVLNGEAREIPLGGEHRTADTTVSLMVERSGWILLRARSDRAIEPVLDLYPYGTTSPVYLTVAGAPTRSTQDADYFLRWIDRLEGAVKASRDWNTDAERDATLDLIRRAREELERRRS